MIKGKSLAVVTDKSVAAVGKRVAVTADTVFFFQESDDFLTGFSFLILPINAEFSLLKPAAANERVVNILLRKHKGGGLRVLRLCDSFDLFRDGRQTAAVILV